MQRALYAIAVARPSVRLSVCPSVRPSVCHAGGSGKSVEVRIMQLSPQSSSIPLVFAL